MFQFFDSVHKLMSGLDEHFTGDEDGAAVVFQCRTGRGRTTTAMAIACKSTVAARRAVDAPASSPMRMFQNLKCCVPQLKVIHER